MNFRNNETGEIVQLAEQKLLARLTTGWEVSYHQLRKICIGKFVSECVYK